LLEAFDLSRWKNDMQNILVVDDDHSVLEVIEMRLSSSGYCVTTATDIRGALKVVNEGDVDLALIDLRLGHHESGLDLLAAIHDVDPDIPIIILTAHASIETAVEAIRKKAYSYVEKPFEGTNLLVQIRNCLKEKSLSREVKQLRKQLKNRHGFDKIIARSEKMHEVIEKIVHASRNDANVYIEGESGTGKELVATTLHEVSLRKDGPFVAINCAAIPETLMESELFGYQKGAFTGATANKKGLIAQAEGGSLFLDEISEMPVSMQAKLLRVIQEKTFYPVGSTKEMSVDMRLITSSNRNLEEAVRTNDFREDLFYRIRVIVIQLPPLRDRKEDIPILSESFRKQVNRKFGLSVKGFSQEALRRLTNYDWPGNVRELMNTIESAAAMTTEEVISEELILQTKSFDAESIKPLKAAREDFERNYLIQLIQKTEGNISMAAKLSGKYRADLYGLFKKYKINPMDYRARIKNDKEE
jgi:two-component system, NtrC family, response regulator GlrR